MAPFPYLSPMAIARRGFDAGVTPAMCVCHATSLGKKGDFGTVLTARIGTWRGHSGRMLRLRSTHERDERGHLSSIRTTFGIVMSRAAAGECAGCGSHHRPGDTVVGNSL